MYRPPRPGNVSAKAFSPSLSRMWQCRPWSPFARAVLCRRVIPGMREREWGKIINVSGGGATGPRPDVTAYACAKTALVRLTETLAEELREAKIDVNAVAPGAMNTRMLDETIAAGPGGARREYKAAVERSRSGEGTPPDRAA